MKQIILIVLSVITVTFCADIKLRVLEAVPDSGTLYIGLYDNDNFFPVPGREVKKAVLTPSSDSVIGTFKNLPVGESYAFFVYQDLDSSGDLTIGASGIPKEPFAFSNHTKMGLQEFLRSAFILKRDMELELVLLWKKEKEKEKKKK